jgi:hypothetical protein
MAILGSLLIALGLMLLPTVLGFKCLWGYFQCPQDPGLLKCALRLLGVALMCGLLGASSTLLF